MDRDTPRFTVKQMERTRKGLETRLERLNDDSRKDDVVTFEELGIDRLFIDEAHNFKNLFLYTKLRNVAGVAQTEAKKSSDLFAKCQYLDELTGGRGVVFATGTPISNSMAELYTMMRYLQYGMLQERGLTLFDEWASTFGEVTTSVELKPEGTGYRMRTRFSRFYNLPELMALWREAADIQTADMLNLPVPEVERKNVVVKPTDIQREMVAELGERAEAVRNGNVDPSEDNMLKITNDGRKLALDQRLIDPLLPDEAGSITEGLPVVRDSSFKAFLPVMYGCNNFCSYCIVPYVRGRERSRMVEAVLEEARSLVEAGYRDITLLGQNVNSYGKDLETPVPFAQLLREINAIPGDFRIRFMTSHPKDCTRELLDAMADCEKVAKHLHLPVQSGNDRVLKEMNRRYTREQYLELIRYARQVMPELSLTSDVIVGFPGETYEAFQDTLSLVEEVGFTSLFTFIFSPREGTPAAKMPDPVSREEKGRWFRELTDLQERVASARNQKLLGKRFRVLVEGPGKKAGLLAGRTEGNLVIEFPGGDSLIGEFVEVVVTEALAWILRGQMEI